MVSGWGLLSSKSHGDVGDREGMPTAHGPPCSNRIVPISLAASQFQGAVVLSFPRESSGFLFLFNVIVYSEEVKRGLPMKQRRLFGSSDPLHVF